MRCCYIPFRVDRIFFTFHDRSRASRLSILHKMHTNEANEHFVSKCTHIYTYCEFSDATFRIVSHRIRIRMRMRIYAIMHSPYTLSFNDSNRYPHSYVTQMLSGIINRNRRNETILHLFAIIFAHSDWDRANAKCVLAGSYVCVCICV